MGANVEATGVLKAEVALMNKLLLNLIDVKAFIELVEVKLWKDTENNVERYVDGDEVSITKEDLDCIIETTFQDEYGWSDNIPTIIYEAVYEKITAKVLRSMESDLHAAIMDQREFERDPLAYYGMSQRDFLS